MDAIFSAGKHAALCLLSSSSNTCLNCSQKKIIQMRWEP